MEAYTASVTWAPVSFIVDALWSNFSSTAPGYTAAELGQRGFLNGCKSARNGLL